jgi:SPX domain protein involved in polyphosphate accumulation
MKFGKRLAAEAARRWRPYYLDYKACKRAIQQDVTAKGLLPTNLSHVKHRF